MLGEPLVKILQHFKENIPVHPTFRRVHDMPLSSGPKLGQILQLFAGKISPSGIDDSDICHVPSSIDSEAGCGALMGVTWGPFLWGSLVSLGGKNSGLSSPTRNTSFILGENKSVTKWFNPDAVGFKNIAKAFFGTFL